MTTPTNRQLSEQAIAEAEQVLREAGFTKNPDGSWPSAAVDSLPEATNATRYWVTYDDPLAGGDDQTFRFDAIDWWDDASMHRHLNGVEVADE